MHDLAFVGFLGLLFALGLRKPFLFVLVYAYIDIVSPQRLTYYLLNSIPISLIAVIASVGGWAIADDKRGLRFAPRQWLLLALLAYCGISTVYADFPAEALDKWDWVWKALAFAIFLPFTLRTKLRIEALLLFMILSASSIIVVGGIKTLFSGGGYGELNLMVSNNAGLYEGSTISTVAVAIVPIILWFSRFGTVFPPNPLVKFYCFALVIACLLIPIGTSTRTGLLCILLVGVMMLRNVKRRLVYMGAAAALVTIAVPFLPAAYLERMQTIKSYQGDNSASTRVAVWKWTLGFVQERPFGGGFEAYRQNKIRFDRIEMVQTDAHNVKIQSTVETDQARAYHSAYFEMLGEQGWPGLTLWLLINLGGIARMEMLRRRYGKPDSGYEWAGSLAGALQVAHMVYMLGASFVGIAFQPFMFMLVGAQIGLDNYLMRRRAAQAWRPIRPSRAPAAEPTPA